MFIIIPFKNKVWKRKREKDKGERSREKDEG